MKQFFAIVLASVAIFIGGSMLEEHETFSTNWFRRGAPDHGSDADRRVAADAVRYFRTVASHFYAAGGDARFADRLPASRPVVDELVADARYLTRNGRTEVPKLIRIEFLTSEVSGGTQAEVTTREYWITETQWTAGGLADRPRSDLLHFRYRLSRDGDRWVVHSWDPIEPPAPETSR